MTPRLHPSQYRFVTSAGLEVTVLRGKDAPAITGGYGGWEVASRPHDVGITRWVGKDPIRMSVPVYFDGWMSKRSQEVPITTLSRMALPDPTTGEPPVLDVLGGTPRRDITRWVVETIDWGTDVIWAMIGGTPARLRQDAVVHLIEYRDDDRVAFSNLPATAVAAGAPRNGRPKPKHMSVVMDNRTLAQVSKDEYGSPKFVRDILDANGIRDKKTIKAGTRLTMP